MINNRKEKTVLTETRIEIHFLQYKSTIVTKKCIYYLSLFVFKKWIVMCITADSYVESMWKGCG